MTASHYFPAVYHRNAWDKDVRITCNAQGLVTAYQANCPSEAQDVRHGGCLIPGFQNAHSHAFQYAMNGVTEFVAAANPHDDFWAWRHAMYDIALKVGPTGMEAIAGCLYAEMLRHGYTRVTEFHYVHHDLNGRPYADAAMISKGLIRAAQAAGIELCLVPVYYNRANFGKPALTEQRRFIFPARDAYISLLEELKAHISRHAPGVTLGHGIHSLRACQEQDAKALLSPDLTEGPIHLHVAEQAKEVNDCRAAWGRRPVEWLLENIALGPRHALVHATHMTEDETTRLARTTACVVICPSTEGNLGDGFFPMAAYRRAHGRWAIGSDSHVGLFPCEELRWLDYQVRLAAQKRNQLATSDYPHSANYLVDGALQGGSQATGLKAGGHVWQPGKPLNGIVLNEDHPIFYGKTLPQTLAAFVFTADTTAIGKVLVHGKTVVSQGRHRHADRLRGHYRDFMASFHQGMG